MAPKFRLDGAGDDELPSDDEFVTPPALTYSPGSVSEEGDDVSDIEVEVAPPELTTPLSRSAKRFKDLFIAEGKDEHVHNRVIDVIKRIFDCLRSKADQRNFTFVDHGTRYLLIPKLYRTVSIDLSQYPNNFSAVISLFSSQNVGRAFIKRIIFDDSNIADKTRPPPGFEALASLAIEKVPLYQLEHFDWPADFALAAMYTLRLMDRQDNLKNLAIYNSTLNVRSAERKATVNAMDQLESLRISADNRSAVRNVQHLIRRHPLKELHLDLRTYQPAEAWLDYNKASAKTNEVIVALFEHVGPLDKCPLKYQLPLTKLTLWHVNLYRSAETWQKVIRPMCLKELEIVNCAWAGNFLAVVGRRQPLLEKVKIRHDDSFENYDLAPANKKHDLSFFDAVAAFLDDLGPPHHTGRVAQPNKAGNALSSSATKQWLTHFELHVIDGGDWPSTCVPEVLQMHAAALEVLCFDMIPTDGDIPQLFCVKNLIKECNVDRLRQLCICSSAFLYCELDFKKINPFTLQLFASYLDLDEHETDPQNIANKALKKLRADHTRLRVVAVSGLENDGWEFFVKCEVMVHGRKQVSMMPTSYAELKKFESDLDILEPEPTDLSRCGRA